MSSETQTGDTAGSAGHEAAPRPSTAIVITTYNHARFLPEAIDSALAQTVPPQEILVVDDGSNDSPDVVVAHYPSVKFIRQNNRGLAAARNTGLRASSSDCVLFLDADDRLLPPALKSNLACLAQHPACAFVYGAHRRISTDGTPRGGDVFTPIGGLAYLDFLRGNPIGMHATVLYRRASLIELGGFDEGLRRCEDYDVFLRLSRLHPVASHPTLVAEYRWHGQNMSQSHFEMLKHVLDVHARQSTIAGQSPDSARAWKDGRAVWREYYCAELVKEAQHIFRDDDDLPSAVRTVASALTASPLVASQQLWRKLKLAARNRATGKRRRKLALGSVRFGSLGSVFPVSDDFGWDRGTPVDRCYIERFLQAHAVDIAGRVLEIGDDSYMRRFGGDKVTVHDVLHVRAEAPGATIIGDLSVSGTLPESAFDCMVLTQTLHLIYDMRAAVLELYRALKPGGVLLLTVPGISQIDRGEWGERWFWSLTAASARRLVGDVFGAQAVTVAAHGNVFSATAFLQGLAAEEIDERKLDPHDPAYPVVVTVRAVKPLDARCATS